MSCDCACHASSGTHRPACTIDTGSSGVEGVTSCSPCEAPTATESGEDGCPVCEATDNRHEPVEGDCVLPHAYDRKRHPPEAKIGHCCRGCVERHRDWLREIVELYATLGEVLLAGSIPDDTAEHQRAKKAPASPSPIRLDAFALLRPGELKFTVRATVDGLPGMTSTYLTELPDIPAVLSGWAQAVYDTVNITATAPEHLAGAAQVLRKYAETLAGLPEVDTYDAELRWVRRALRNAHGLGQPQDFGVCISVTEARECRGRVVSEHGETAHCKRCGRKYETLDLVRLKRSQKEAS